MQDEARTPKNHAGTSFGKRLLATAMGTVVAGGGLIAAAPTTGAAEGCAGEATAYERAIVAGTAEALQAFLKEYPACPLTPAAFALLNTPRGEQSAATPPDLPGIAPAAGDGPASAADHRTGPDDPGRSDSSSGGGDPGGGDSGGPESGGPEGAV